SENNCSKETNVDSTDKYFQARFDSAEYILDLSFYHASGLQPIFLAATIKLLVVAGLRVDIVDDLSSSTKCW
ncbi:14527_t:CDS:2, partial [Cetraspora pellucida]